MVDIVKEKEEYSQKVRLIKRKLSLFVKNRKETFSVAEKNTRSILIALDIKTDRPRDMISKLKKSLLGLEEKLSDHDKEVERKRILKEESKRKRTKKKKS
mgnify:CR=1 FL=1